MKNEVIFNNQIKNIQRNIEQVEKELESIYLKFKNIDNQIYDLQYLYLLDSSLKEKKLSFFETEEYKNFLNMLQVLSANYEPNSVAASSLEDIPKAFEQEHYKVKKI